MNSSDSEDAEWENLVDSQLKEQQRNRSLLKRVRPLLCVFGGMALLVFVLEARFSTMLQERTMAYATANNPVGISKAQFKRWVARKKYPILRETSRQMTIVIWGKDVGISRYHFMADDAAKISANFDSRARLVSFGPATKTTIGWYS